MTEKSIVVTGASGGIGAALAKQLSARGDKILLAARTQTKLETIATECGKNTIPAVADVTKREDVIKLCEDAIREFGNLDVWVNNAGRGIVRSVLDLTDEDFDEMMLSNVKSALYGMQAVIPHFKKRGMGHLINVSSYLGRVPWITFRSAYSAAKSALNVLTANLRMELRSEYPNIHVSLVLPGAVSTEFGANSLHIESAKIPPGFRSLHGVQSPEEVAAIIVQLIDKPEAEVYTNPIQGESAKRYYRDVAVFEEELAKQMQS